MSRGNRIAPLALLVAAASALLACEERAPDRWLALAYPDPTNLMRFEVAGEYVTPTACLAAARELAGPGGSYECGLNCEQRPSGMNVCERTIGNER